MFKRTAGTLAALPTGDRRVAALRSAGKRPAARHDRTSAEQTRAGKRVWTINGDFLGLHPTGVARYAREVTVALDRLVAEGHPLTRGLALDIVAPTAGREPLALAALPVRIVPEFRRPRLPQVWVQMQLPAHVRAGLLSFCNLAPVAVKRQIVCIHDLHTRLMPESYGRGFRLAHDLILPRLGRRAAKITTVSELSRSHLVAHGIAPADKIVVTYNGSDHARRWNAARSDLSPAGRPYVLCLGRPQKYKNVALMVELAPLLDSLGVDLWMAGDVELAEAVPGLAALPANLRLLGRIDDDDFGKALSGAVAFLFPSRIEGFGLPAVEAMVAGCPVIASTAPCLPEVCGEAALYADPDDAAAWAAAVRRLLDDDGLSAGLKRAGQARAELYTWRGIAERYLELMQEIDFEQPAGVRRGWLGGSS